MCLLNIHHRINGSPRLERFVRLFAHQVLFQFIEVEADGSAIRHMAFELPMLEGALQSFFPRFEEDFASLFGHIDAGCLLREMFGSDLPFLDKGEDGAVDQAGA
jgi:hypothetical protein